MLVFQHVPVQAFMYPTSFSGIFSEDDYVTANMAQRVAHDYALANARIQAVEHQRGHYHHYHPHRPQHHPGGPHMGHFAPESLDNFCYGFSPAPARPAFFSSNRRAASHSPQVLANRVWQQQERQHVLNRRLEAIARQQEVAREREEQSRRALAEAAAREQQARAAHAARIHARQARDQEVLFALLAQMGLAIAPAQSAPVASQVDRQQPSVSFVPLGVPAVSAPATSPIHLDRKGKGKAVDVPVEATTPVSTAPVPERAPTLKERLQARIYSETDPDVQTSLVMLYSDLFDTREPTQPVAGPSGHKHVSFEVPISGPSSTSPADPVPVEAEEDIDIAAPVTLAQPEITETKTDEHGGANLHRTPALPPVIAAKLLKFYRARRARRLSLAQIKDVEDALRQLEGTFEFPSHLDFFDRSPSQSTSPLDSDSDTESALAYTANNSPVHAYEHALNNLLTRLDAVESNGDLEVRGRRKEVVKEVERALEAMERRVDESRERSRERSRRRSVSSQVVSDASATVTPYNVHSPDNLDKVEVDSDAPVEASAEREATKPTPEVEDAPAITEDASPQAEVLESPHSIANDSEELEVTSAPPSADDFELDHPNLVIGMPDSGADAHAPSPSDQSIHGDPSSPDDEVQDLEPAFNVFSPPGDNSTSKLTPSAVDEACALSWDADIDVVVQGGDVCAASADATSEPVMEAVGFSSEPTEDARNRLSLPTAVATLEPMESRVESSDTDAAAVTTTLGSASFSSAPANSITSSTVGTTNSCEPKPTQPLTSETFLLASTPLAEDQPRRRRPSMSRWDDELEIIGEDELEAARNGSDWSDVESESNM